MRSSAAIVRNFQLNDAIQPCIRPTATSTHKARGYNHTGIAVTVCRAGFEHWPVLWTASNLRPYLGVILPSEPGRSGCDGLSRCSLKNKAMMRWVFQHLPRPVGLTWKSLYESVSRTPLKGCVVQVAVHPRCSRSSPVRFTAPVRLLTAATAMRWD